MTDTCSSLAAEIAALRAEIARIPRVNEARIIETAKIQAKDLIMPLVVSYVLSQLKPIQQLISTLENTLFTISGQITNILGKLAALETAILNALKTAASALGISNQALKEIGVLFAKIAPLLNVLGQILNLIGIIGTLETLGARIDAVERGIDRLGADISSVLGKLLGIQNRIERVEGDVSAVRVIATDARLIGEAANRAAGSAQITAARAQGAAETAINNAKNAQSTADGAVRNAKQANDNATTAYNTALKADAKAGTAQQSANASKSIAEQAKGLAGQALGKAGEALGVALTAIALVQTVRALRGLQGVPGIPGKNGAPGRDGVTTVVQLPGIPGAQGVPGRDGRNGTDGRNGINGAPGRNGTNGINGAPGTNGKNGVDAVPYNDASLKTFIAQQHVNTQTVSSVQHSQTQGTVNGFTATIFGGFQAFITGRFAALTKLVTDIATNTYVEKAVALLTLAATFHNALMLSSNLGQTLGGIINTLLGLIFPKGIDGKTLDVFAILGTTAEALISDAVGADNFVKLKAEWAAANRIYQASVNVLNALQNAQNAIMNGLEVIGGQLAKVANALKKWGVLGEKAYEWFNPQPNFHNKTIIALQNAQEGAQMIDAVVQVPVSIAAAATEYRAADEEFKKAIKGDKNEDGTEKAKGIAVEENKPKKEEFDLGQQVSKGFEVIFEEMFDAGE